MLAETGREWNASLEMKKNTPQKKKDLLDTDYTGVDSWMCFLLVQYNTLLWDSFLYIKREEKEYIFP